MWICAYPCCLGQGIVHPPGIEARFKSALRLVPEYECSLSTVLPQANLRTLPESGHGETGQYEARLNLLPLGRIVEVAKEGGGVKEGKPVTGGTEEKTKI